MTEEQADNIAVRAVQYITADHELMARFLALSGYDVADLPVAIKERNFWAAMLDFLRQDEAECLAFASNAALAPLEIEKASLILNGHNPHDLNQW